MPQFIIIILMTALEYNYLSSSLLCFNFYRWLGIHCFAGKIIRIIGSQKQREQVDILISKNQTLQILYLKHCVYKTT